MTLAECSRRPQVCRRAESEWGAVLWGGGESCQCASNSSPGVLGNSLSPAARAATRRQGRGPPRHGVVPVLSLRRFRPPLTRHFTRGQRYYSESVAGLTWLTEWLALLWRSNDVVLAASRKHIRYGSCSSDLVVLLVFVGQAFGLFFLVFFFLFLFSLLLLFAVFLLLLFLF